MSNIKAMQAQLATIKAKKVRNPATPDISDDETTWIEASATFLGAVPSATKGFFSDIGTSYKYHEAKRKGLI